MPIRESVKGLNKSLEFNRAHGNWLIVQKVRGMWGMIITSVSQPMFLDVARHMTKDMPKESFSIVDKRTKKGIMAAEVREALNYEQ